MKKSILFLLLVSIAMIGFSKKTPPKQPSKEQQELNDQVRLLDSLLKIEKSFHYKTGIVNLGNGIATINVPKGFKFLESKEAQYVLEDLWGNLKDEPPLGLLIPEDGNVVLGSWAFIVSYSPIGYVKDEDADKIDYDDLLKEIQKDEIEANKQRAAAGIDAMTLLGWAKKPFYDKQKKTLHWAKEYAVVNDSLHTLNYDVILLGRKGTLGLRAIATMDNLDSVNSKIDNVISMVSFSDGNKYNDFDSKTDNIAAWTIGGLVAGKVLAKVGILAGLGKFFVIAWKFILAGLAAAGAAIKRLFKRKTNEEEIAG